MVTVRVLVSDRGGEDPTGSRGAPAGRRVVLAEKPIRHEHDWGAMTSHDWPLGRQIPTSPFS